MRTKPSHFQSKRCLPKLFIVAGLILEASAIACWSGAPPRVEIANALPKIEVAGGIVTNLREPVITAVRIEKENVIVEGDIPAGVLKVTLESRDRLGAGAWQPRLVQRTEGQGGPMTFRLLKGPAIELLRLRADSTDPLPLSFYKGTNQFNGAIISGSVLAEDANKSLVPVAGIADRTAEGTATADRSVVESDIWKIQNGTLYFFNQYRGLQVIDISNLEEPQIRGELAMPAVGEQMYILGDGTAVLLARNGCGWGEKETSQVIVVSTGSEPKILASMDLPGSIQESRMVGSALYVASQQYRPVSGAKDGTWEWGAVVTSFDLAEPASPKTRGTLWFAGYGNVITATDQFLFVALRNQNWNGPATVRCIDISKPDGSMQLTSLITPRGVIQDKFKIHLNGTVLTLISERWEEVQQRGQTVTVLETFSLQNPSVPVKLGQIELGRGERLFATRFDGDRVYIVTFLRIDPLWIVDLSNPAKPTISGELHIPGWSTYIQPLGDQLVTIGIDNTNGWRVAVSLFDVSDTKAPKLSSKVPLGENYSWSEANSDEKAFTVLPEAGLILVPYQGYTTNGYAARVQILDLDLQAKTLKARGVIDHAMQPRRATALNDRILSISGRELLTVDATNRDKPAVRSKTTLSWAANRVWVSGNHQIQLDESSAYTGVSTSLLRVVANAQLDTLLSSMPLTPGLRVMGGTIQENKLFLAEAKSSEVTWEWFEKEQTSRPVRTNESVFKLTVFDLSRLPQLVVIGETSTALADPGYGGDLAPYWPKPGILVWSSRGGYWGPWWRGLAADVAVEGRASKIAFPWWGGNTQGTLFAFDVSTPQKPSYISKTQLAPQDNMGRWNYSDPQISGGLVYVSYQTSTFVEGGLLPGELPPKPILEPQPDGTTEIVQPVFGVWVQRYYLSVIDYADPASPQLRKPVNIPGQLVGLGFGGSVLYTTGNQWDAKNTTDGSEWLVASSYDGTQAQWITSHALPREWPHPVSVKGDVVFIGKPGDGKTTKPTLETYVLNGAGVFALLNQLPLPTSVQALLSYDTLLVAQCETLTFIDATQPVRLEITGEAEMPGCLYYDLTHASGNLQAGLWVPLQDYGVRHLQTRSPQP